MMGIAINKYVFNFLLLTTFSETTFGMQWFKNLCSCCNNNTTKQGPEVVSEEQEIVSQDIASYQATAETKLIDPEEYNEYFHQKAIKHIHAKLIKLDTINDGTFKHILRSLYISCHEPNYKFSTTTKEVLCDIALLENNTETLSSATIEILKTLLLAPDSDNSEDFKMWYYTIKVIDFVINFKKLAVVFINDTREEKEYALSLKILHENYGLISNPEVKLNLSDKLAIAFIGELIKSIFVEKSNKKFYLPFHTSNLKIKDPYN